MKFGIREIANVVFKAKNAMVIGGKSYAVGQPVLYIDSAKTSSLEGAATTVYATGGRGNARLIAWEGQKTLTLTIEDALLSPVSFSMLSGAGLFKGASDSTDKIHFHQTSRAMLGADGVIDLTDALEATETIDATAPLYIMQVDDEGDLTGKIYSSADTTIETIALDNTSKKINIKAASGSTLPVGAVLVDYYVVKNANTVSELQIDMEHFAGFYYVEADALFRAQNGKDLPVNITLPNVKIQSNFTFSMAATGDPSTFSFTLDAFPGYTYFDKTKKVLCAIQIVDDVKDINDTFKTIFPHPSDFNIKESISDSIPDAGNEP